LTFLEKGRLRDLGQNLSYIVSHSDWLMICAKADWLTSIVIIFPCSLIGQFKISLCFGFGCDVICAICGSKVVPTLVVILWASL